MPAHLNPAIALPSRRTNAPPSSDPPGKLDTRLPIRPNTSQDVSWELVSSTDTSSPDSTRPSTSSSHCDVPLGGDEEFVEFMTKKVIYSSTTDGLLDGSPLSPSSPFTPFPSPSLTPSPTVPFDTSAFPPHAHLFPSSSNGTWRNEALHALKNPHTIDPADLRDKLLVLVEDASDEVSAKLNKMCEGKDVPAMHDRVVGCLPEVKLPNRRGLSRVIERGWEAGVGVLKMKMGKGVEAEEEEMEDWVDMGDDWEVDVMTKK